MEQHAVNVRGGGASPPPLASLEVVVVPICGTCKNYRWDTDGDVYCRYKDVYFHPREARQVWGHCGPEGIHYVQLATVAQSEEHPPCKRDVGGANPSSSSIAGDPVISSGS